MYHTWILWVSILGDVDFKEWYIDGLGPGGLDYQAAKTPTKTDQQKPADCDFLFFEVTDFTQHMVNRWFRARWFGFRLDPLMKGIANYGHPKNTRPNRQFTIRWWLFFWFMASQPTPPGPRTPPKK